MPSLRPCTPPPRLQALINALPAPKKGHSLEDLYKTAWTDIPTRVLARDPPHLLQTDLAQILDFKLAFGQNRPALRGMIAALKDEEVRKASEASFDLLKQAEATDGSERDSLVLKSLQALTVLRGVGPATASLVLSLLSPSVPFFSDEAAVVILRPAQGRKGLRYNEKEYKAFLEAVGEKGGAGGQREWERKTWVDEMSRELSLDDVEASAPKKGKRESEAMDGPAPADVQAAPKVADGEPKEEETASAEDLTEGRRMRSRTTAGQSN